jgi:hypothetical protein
MDQKTFIAQVEQAWRKKTTSDAGKRLTRLHVHIAAKLAFWRSPQCRQRALARAAGCSVRTVRRAIHLLNALSLLGWTKIIIRGHGWRVRVMNAYSLGKKEILSLVYDSPANLSPAWEIGLLEKARRRLQRAQEPAMAQKTMPF